MKKTNKVFVKSTTTKSGFRNYVRFNGPNQPPATASEKTTIAGGVTSNPRTATATTKTTSDRKENAQASGTNHLAKTKAKAKAKAKPLKDINAVNGVIKKKSGLAQAQKKLVSQAKSGKVGVTCLCKELCIRTALMSNKKLNFWANSAIAHSLRNENFNCNCCKTDFHGLCFLIGWNVKDSEASIVASLEMLRSSFICLFCNFKRMNPFCPPVHFLSKPRLIYPCHDDELSTTSRNATDGAWTSPFTVPLGLNNSQCRSKASVGSIDRVELRCIVVSGDINSSRRHSWPPKFCVRLNRTSPLLSRNRVPPYLAACREKDMRADSHNERNNALQLNCTSRQGCSRGDLSLKSDDTFFAQYSEITPHLFPKQPWVLPKHLINQGKAANVLTMNYKGMQGSAMLCILVAVRQLTQSEIFESILSNQKISYVEGKQQALDRFASQHGFPSPPGNDRGKDKNIKNRCHNGVGICDNEIDEKIAHVQGNASEENLLPQTDKFAACEDQEECVNNKENYLGENENGEVEYGAKPNKGDGEDCSDDGNNDADDDVVIISPPARKRKTICKIFLDDDTSLGSEGRQCGDDKSDFPDFNLWNLSLVCIDTGLRLRHAARSIHCRHVQCFDLTFFISHHEKSGCAGKNAWTCGRCGSSAFPEEIVIDEFIQHFVDHTGDDCIEVEYSQWN